MSDQPAYRYGGREWWQQFAASLDALAGTYTKRSPYERAMKAMFTWYAGWARRHAAKARRP